MRRLLATLRCDGRIQLRSGFYWAGGFVAVVSIAILTQFPPDSLGRALPALLFFSLNVTTFYFVAGLVIYEKGEGTLEVQVVTPLRVGEYLASKVVTLTGLAIAESLLIVVLAYGWDFHGWALLAGMAFLGVIYTLLGFLAVARFDSINEFLLPSTLIVAAIQLPVVDALGLWPSPIWKLWPTRPPLTLLEAAFGTAELWEVVYGIGYSAISVAVLGTLAARSFRRFIVRREGSR